MIPFQRTRLEWKHRYFHWVYVLIYMVGGMNTMNQPYQDGQVFEENGVEYLYEDEEITEIACSYPDVETGLAALQAKIDAR